MSSHFNYKWNIADGYPDPVISSHLKKVFGTFICGGGSTMGYKRSGYDHLGGVEIDEQIAAVYKANHKPKYLFTQDLRDFISRTDLPTELYELDILDGSPPCSTFSMAGNREDDWGKEKLFREGQTMQRLDDLFFDYIALTNKLRPKVAVAENVVGLIQGNAKAYVHDIYQEFKRIGYTVQLFKLNAASMGVPQKRERVFFIARRADLNLPNLRLSFNEKPIPFSQVEKLIPTSIGKPISEAYKVWWSKCKPGYALSSVHPEGSFFNTKRIWRNQVCSTITATVAGKILHYSQPAEIHEDAIKLCGSFPMDYDFQDVEPKYLIGMSVPPVMMAQISNQIYIQWLSNLK